MLSWTFFTKIFFAIGAMPKLQMYENLVDFIWEFLAIKLSWNIVLISFAGSSDEIEEYLLSLILITNEFQMLYDL